MNEASSRKLMLYEFVLLVAPITAALPFVYEAAIAADLASEIPISKSVVPLLLLSVVPLSAGWRLGIGFIARGRAALRTRRIWWLLATFGALMLTASAIVLVLLTSGVAFREYPVVSEGNPFGLGPRPDVVRFIGYASLIGMPLLIPFVHLVLERGKGHAL